MLSSSEYSSEHSLPPMNQPLRLPANQHWSPQLVLEDALQLFSDEELCTRFTLTIGELAGLRNYPAYAHAVAATRREIAEQGLTFKHKARIQAEQFLDEVATWMGDAETPVKDKLAVLGKLVEWGELAPKPQAGGLSAAGAGFTFVVNLPGAAPTTLTMHQRETGRVLDAPAGPIDTTPGVFDAIADAPPVAAAARAPVTINSDLSANAGE